MSPKPKRKHRKTGLPRGGGPGRRKGFSNALTYGAVAAIESMRWRVPDSASEEAKAVADRAMARIIHVMEAKVWEKQARAVLGAATYLREEICGPIPKKLELGLGELTDEQVEARWQAILTKTREAGPNG